MARPIRLMGLVVLAVFIAGFGDTGKVWAQAPPATGCTGCNGDVPVIRVGVNPRLEIRVGWDRYVLIPGSETASRTTVFARHYAVDTLKFLVDFSEFEYPLGPDEALNVAVHVEWLGEEQGGNKAKVTNETVDKKAVLNKRIGLRAIKKAILFKRFTLDPTPDEINRSNPVVGATYTFHPEFTLMHTAGDRCSLPDPVNNLPAETEWANGSEPSEWSRDHSGVVGNIPGHVGRSADYGPKSFTVTGEEDELVPLTPILN